MVASVIAFSAATELDQALHWFNEYEPPAVETAFASREFIAATIGTAAATDSRRGEIANRLLARKADVGAAMVLARMTAAWTLVDSASAMDWIVSSNAVSDPQLVANVARTLAERDARGAAAFTHLLPPEARRMWIRAVVARYGGQDPEGAADWVMQLQSEPGYDTMFSQVVRQAAMTDPATAARMVLSAPDELQQSVAPEVASAWAALDLRGAAEWAANLDNPRSRAAAIDQVARSWAHRDPQSAQRWAALLPRGEIRDHALSSILDRLVRDNLAMTIDWQLLADFDSEVARDRVLSSLLEPLAISDPERTKVLLEKWLSDPVLRQRALRAVTDVAADQARP
jgi:hypothetical protein